MAAGLAGWRDRGAAVHRAATAGGDGTARLWDVATHRQIGVPMTVAPAVIAVAFSPDGKVLATADTDGTAQLWDVAFPSNLLRVTCSIAGRSLTHQEWSAYGSPVQYRNCP